MNFYGEIYGVKFRVKSDKSLSFELLKAIKQMVKLSSNAKNKTTPGNQHIGRS